jgi:hypothetical protein
MKKPARSRIIVARSRILLSDQLSAIGRTDASVLKVAFYIPHVLVILTRDNWLDVFSSELDLLLGLDLAGFPEHRQVFLGIA